MKTGLSFLSRDALRFVYFWAVLLSVLNGGVLLANEKGPNVLFILVDDLGWSDLGCYGSTLYQTPNIDRFATEGMSFSAAYAASMCSPSRASIMTGKYPARLGITTWIGDKQPDNFNKNTKHLPPRYVDRLPLEEVTIAETLREHGYATQLAGKWHLGPERFFPEDQGFDINRGGVNWSAPNGGKRYFSPYGNKRLEDGPDGEHLPDRLAGEAIAFMKEQSEAGRSFFAYLPFYSVHVPLMAPADLIEKYQRKDLPEDRYRDGVVRKDYLAVQNNPIVAAMVEAMDRAVGKVLTSLTELGLDDDTIVIFTSDNGGTNHTSNAPLRAGKCHLYEGGIRVPLIMRWPGKIEPGSSCSEMVSFTDFYPTILDLLDLPLLPDQHLDGISFAPLLDGADSLPRDTLYWHFPHYMRDEPSSAIRSGDWKLIEFFEDDRLELYNLEEDLGEHVNLVAKHPDRVKHLHKRLKLWRQSVDAAMLTENPNYDPTRP